MPALFGKLKRLSCARGCAFFDWPSLLYRYLQTTPTKKSVPITSKEDVHHSRYSVKSHKSGRDMASCKYKHTFNKLTVQSPQTRNNRNDVRPYVNSKRQATTHDISPVLDGHSRSIPAKERENIHAPSACSHAPAPFS